MPDVPVPAFPERTFSILDYGAVPNGSTMNTEAFARAIEACSSAGGGTVEVPPGTWLTGPVRLESNVNLHVRRGAVIQFSSRIADYPLIKGFDGKSKKYIITPPLSAWRARNIAISGEGIIDGAGEVWRYVKKEKLTSREWKNLVASGGVVSPNGDEWWPSLEALRAPGYMKEVEASGVLPPAEEFAAHTREFLRPDMVQLVQCKGILLDGTTFRNSPKFHVRPIQSENVIIRNIKIQCPWYAQNGDGLDPTSCRNVVIYNSTVDVGDDGICLKPGTIAKSQRPGPSCENIVIDACIVYRAHGGFVIGSESEGGVNNVYVHNCVFMGTDVGLRFKSLRGRGGLVRNVFIDGIQMKFIETDGILFDMYYGGGAPDVEADRGFASGAPQPVTDRTPRFRDFVIRDVVCNGAKRALLIHGLPEMPISNISLDSVFITSGKGVFIVEADSVTLDGCTIVSREGPDVSVTDGRNISIVQCKFPAPVNIFLNVAGPKSSGIRLTGVDASGAKEKIKLAPGLNPDVVSER